MSREFELGETKVVSGKVTIDKFTGRLTMSSPDVVAPLADLDKVRNATVQAHLYPMPCQRGHVVLLTWFLVALLYVGD